MFVRRYQPWGVKTTTEQRGRFLHIKVSNFAFLFIIIIPVISAVVSPATHGSAGLSSSEEPGVLRR
jgi:hypothetical protein